MLALGVRRGGPIGETLQLKEKGRQPETIYVAFIVLTTNMRRQGAGKAEGRTLTQASV